MSRKLRVSKNRFGRWRKPRIGEYVTDGFDHYGRIKEDGLHYADRDIVLKDYKTLKIITKVEYEFHTAKQRMESDFFSTDDPSFDCPDCGKKVNGWIYCKCPDCNPGACLPSQIEDDQSEGKSEIKMKTINPDDLFKAINKPCPICGKMPIDDNTWTGEIDDLGFGIYCKDPCVDNALSDGSDLDVNGIKEWKAATLKDMEKNIKCDQCKRRVLRRDGLPCSICRDQYARSYYIPLKGPLQEPNEEDGSSTGITCPECGSENIQLEPLDEDIEHYANVLYSCDDCGWIGPEEDSRTKSD